MGSGEGVKMAKFEVKLDVHGLGSDAWDDWCNSALPKSIESVGVQLGNVEIWHVEAESLEAADELVDAQISAWDDVFFISIAPVKE